ncbi:MAG: hypothetical protein U1A78_26675 [Polyangia bacterium]
MVWLSGETTDRPPNASARPDVLKEARGLTKMYDKRLKSLSVEDLTAHVDIFTWENPKAKAMR